MPGLDIAAVRLSNQKLASTGLKKPADVVKWMGAIQAQDYSGAKWALGQRMLGATDASIEKAFADGTILRTHVMRPTWHFVAANDIRWMLELTAPRVNIMLRSHYRQLELDDDFFRRSNKTLSLVLRGGKQLTREELRIAVERLGVVTGSLHRFGIILARAELDRIICSGARKGKQFTYALLDERAPEAKAFVREEALARLTQRYFASHGPATLLDFAWWSGLTVADCRAGIELVGKHLVKEVVDDRVYWLPPSTLSGASPSSVTHLLPTYDEFLIAYKDRSASLHPNHREKLTSAAAGFTSTIVIGGRVIGSWRRTLGKSLVTITLRPFEPFSKDQEQSVARAVRNYGAFFDMKPVLA